MMEDPEHEDVFCKNPDCKKPNQKWNTILRHIALAKSCKNHYSIKDRELLKARSGEIQAKKELKRKNENYDPAKRKAKYNSVAAKKSYDPAKRKAKYDPVAAKKAYDPSKSKAKYDPVANKESYDPKKRKVKHNKEYLPEKRSKVYQEKKLQEQKSSKVRIRKFIRECQFGPIFTCLCCKRDLFQTGCLWLHEEKQVVFEVDKKWNLQKILGP